jgi:hypothetical protein
MSIKPCFFMNPDGSRTPRRSSELPGQGWHIIKLLPSSHSVFLGRLGNNHVDPISKYIPLFKYEMNISGHMAIYGDALATAKKDVCFSCSYLHT